MGYQRLLYQSFLWRGLYFISTFLVNILVARYYQATVSGWIYYITNLYAFILLLASLSLESGIWFYVSKGTLDIARVINSALLWTSVVAGAIITVIALVPIEYPEFISKNLFLLSSISYVCGILLTNYMVSIFFGKQNFFVPNIICLGCNLLVIVALFVSFYFPGSILNEGSFIRVYFLVFLLQGFLLTAAAIKKYTPGWAWGLTRSAQLSNLLRYSLTAFSGNVIFFLVYRVDYYFVERYCSPEALGNYVQVSKIGQVLITLPTILATAVFSSTAGGEQQETREGLPQLSRVLLLVSGLMCLALAIFGAWLFPFIFGPTYGLMYGPFVLLIPGILALSILYPLSAYYSGKNQLRANVIGGSIGLACILAGDIVLIPRFGILAAATVSSAGYMAYYFYLLWLFRRDYKADIRNFFVIKKADIGWVKTLLLNRSKG